MRDLQILMRIYGRTRSIVSIAAGLLSFTGVGLGVLVAGDIACTSYAISQLQ